MGLGCANLWAAAANLSESCLVNVPERFLAPWLSLSPKDLDGKAAKSLEIQRIDIALQILNLRIGMQRLVSGGKQHN